MGRRAALIYKAEMFSELIRNFKELLESSKYLVPIEQNSVDRMIAGLTELLAIANDYEQEVKNPGILIFPLKKDKLEEIVGINKEIFNKMKLEVPEYAIYSTIVNSMEIAVVNIDKHSFASF